MRIKMSGQYLPHEFQDAIDSIVQSLVVNGMHEIRSANLYINAIRGDRYIDFEDQETGAPFVMLEYKGRTKREFKIRSPRLQPARDDSGE